MLNFSIYHIFQILAIQKCQCCQLCVLWENWNASLNFESFTHVHYHKYVFQQLLDILLKTAAEGGNVDPHKVREILTDGTTVVAPPTDETITGT